LHVKKKYLKKVSAVLAKLTIGYQTVEDALLNKRLQQKLVKMLQALGSYAYRA